MQKTCTSKDCNQQLSEGLVQAENKFVYGTVWHQRCTDK